jgi:hypothetical protein
VRPLFGRDLFHGCASDQLATPAAELLAVFGLNGAARAVVVSFVGAGASGHLVSSGPVE